MCNFDMRRVQWGQILGPQPKTRGLLTAAAISLALSACASPASYDWTWCADEDERHWQRTTEIPENADELRRLADSKTYSRSVSRSIESWFRLPGGEVMLCRQSWRATEIEWWQFRQTGQN